jgi:membrane protein implicated in regulation of membrane protease activity
MNWANFYLICFVVGFSFSMLMFLTGSLHWHVPFKWHLPHAGVHHGPDVHLPHAGAHVGHDIGTHAHASGYGGISPFNLLTLSAFFTWFGGTGYLLTRYYGVWGILAASFSTLSGLTGAVIVFWFMAKVLMASDDEENVGDYHMIGALGKVSSTIRERGTGEIVFSQGGTRHVAGARSEDGSVIPKDSEVIVTRHEGGIAYVRRWEEMSNLDPETSSSTADRAKAAVHGPEADTKSS